MNQPERQREIGARIKRARRSGRILQKQLAHHMGFAHVQVVYNIEAGLRMVTLAEAVEIAKFLDVDLTYLAGTSAGFRVNPNVLPGLRYARTVLDTAIKEAES